jgi:Na+-transporting methylmalonyl-CoA/oxaloacetate decarboxylase gamma subunit
MAMKNKKASRVKEINAWKMVSAVFIVLFVLILAVGFIHPRIRPAFTEPTQEQASMAESIVAQDLQARGDSISNYEVSVTNRIVGFIGEPYPGNERLAMRQFSLPGEPESFRNIQVSLRGNTTAYLYIVDIGSEKVVMRSFTEWFSV